MLEKFFKNSLLLFAAVSFVAIFQFASLPGKAFASEAPIASLLPQEISTNQSVNFSTSDYSYDIYYTSTSDGTTPPDPDVATLTNTTHVAQPMSNITITPGQKFKALAYSEALSDTSPIAEFDYPPTDPTFPTNPGNFHTDFDVTISTSVNSASVCYTIGKNGALPQDPGIVTNDSSSPTTVCGVGSVTVTLKASDGNITIKALTVVNGSRSAVASSVYSGSLITPIATPAPGSIILPQDVTFSSTSLSAGLCWTKTTDGTAPVDPSVTTGGDTTCTTNPVTYSINPGDTYKFIATENAVASSVFLASFPIGSLPASVATPTANPGGGTYTSSQSVTLSTATQGASIYYTTDGSTPSFSSNLYSAPIVISSSLTLKAIAIKSGMPDSNLMQINYVIFSGASSPSLISSTSSSSSSSSSNSSKNKKNDNTRYIKNSNSHISRGKILVQSGKHFSKNSQVMLYFQKSNGTYYAPIQVKTDNKGSFSVSYLVKKPAGKYGWYAVDAKNGWKSKTIYYSVN